MKDTPSAVKAIELSKPIQTHSFKSTMSSAKSTNNNGKETSHCPRTPSPSPRDDAVSTSEIVKAAARDAILHINADPANGISLCIPRVFNNIGWRRIKQIFIDLRWGFVERVDVIKLGKHKRAFVHFAPGKWNTRDQEAMDALKALQQGDEVKILYDDPWYWKISISSSARPTEAPKPRERPRTTIQSKDNTNAVDAADNRSASRPQERTRYHRRPISYKGVDQNAKQ